MTTENPNHWLQNIAGKQYASNHTPTRQPINVKDLGADTSLAESTESAGMLRYFAQICLQIFTSFPQIYDVQRF